VRIGVEAPPELAVVRDELARKLNSTEKSRVVEQNEAVAE
jgi:sRNA-binding carbon storage regulator CsrA